MDNFRQLQATALGALSQPGAPAPLSDTSYGPALQKFFDIGFKLPLSSAASQAAVGQAGVIDKQAELARQQELERLKDKAEGKGYRREPRQDGGFGFYDPDGNEISAYEYARATGTTVYKALSDSDNPIDKQFAEDYQNLQDYMNARVNNDVESIQAIEERVRKDTGIDLSQEDIRTVMERFKRAYPTVYGFKQAGQRQGRTFIPNLNVLRDALESGGTGVGG